jgi:hypothetical protein
MLGLTAQRRSFDIVISDISRCKTKVADFQEDLSKFGFQYYMIIHDKDVDNQGALIRTHIHLVIVSSKTLRVKQVINLLSDSLVTNPENIQVQEVISLSGSIQYLLHLNNKEKYQYSRDEILTNDIDNLEGYLIEQACIEKLTTKGLLDYILVQELSRLDLIQAIGIGAYTHYHKVIDELYELRKVRNF